jgi:ABC-type microcin C transport system permease subunit YejB
MIPPSGLWVLLILGLISVGLGFGGAYGWRKPWDVAGALLALLGLSVALISVLLLHLPNFF